METFATTAALTVLGTVGGWIAKAYFATRAAGKKEAVAETNAAHLQKDFESFKSETSHSFSKVHERIDREKERRSESEGRMSLKFDELIRGQGVIEGKLTAIMEILPRKRV